MWETMLKLAERDYFRIPISQGILKTRSRLEEDLCVSSGSQTAVFPRFYMWGHIIRCRFTHGRHLRSGLFGIWWLKRYILHHLKHWEQTVWNTSEWKSEEIGRFLFDSSWLRHSKRTMFSTRLCSPFWTCVGSKWFLVEHGELLLPSSCWTQSQTPCAERRDSPNSTAIPWRFEGYKYDFGCIAGTTPCWRLLEHWWWPRIIRCTARIYMDYPLGRKTSRRL